MKPFGCLRVDQALTKPDEKETKRQMKGLISVQRETDDIVEAGCQFYVTDAISAINTAINYTKKPDSDLDVYLSKRLMLFRMGVHHTHIALPFTKISRSMFNVHNDDHRILVHELAQKCKDAIDQCRTDAYLEDGTVRFAHLKIARRYAVLTQRLLQGRPQTV